MVVGTQDSTNEPLVVYSRAGVADPSFDSKVPEGHLTSLLLVEVSPHNPVHPHHPPKRRWFKTKARVTLLVREQLAEHGLTAIGRQSIVSIGIVAVSKLGTHSNDHPPNCAQNCA